MIIAAIVLAIVAAVIHGLKPIVYPYSVVVIVGLVSLLVLGILNAMGLLSILSFRY